MAHVGKPGSVIYGSGGFPVGVAVGSGALASGCVEWQRGGMIVCAGGRDGNYTTFRDVLACHRDRFRGFRNAELGINMTAEGDESTPMIDNYEEAIRIATLISESCECPTCLAYSKRKPLTNLSRLVHEVEAS